MGNDNEGTEDDNEGTEDDNADNDDEGHNEDNNLRNNKLDNDEVKDNDGNDLFSVFACFFTCFLQDLCLFWQLLDPSMPSFWALALCIFFMHFFGTLFEFIQAVWLPCGSCLPPSLQK